MSDPASENAEPSLLGSSSSPHNQTRFSWKPQFSLRTLMLLTTAVAVFVAYVRTRNETERMRRQIPGLQEISRELTVTDPDQYAVVRRYPPWRDEFRWRIHLPEGRRYELSLATEKIEKGIQQIAVAAGTFQLTSGEHELELQQHQEEDGSWRILVLVDEETVLTQKEPESWNPRLGSSETGNFPVSKQQNVKKPLVIFQRRFAEQFETDSFRMPDYPCNGILLWIEPVAEE